MQRIPHGEHEVNRIAVAPGSQDLIATSSDCGDAFVFKLSAQRQQQQQEEEEGLQGSIGSLENRSSSDFKPNIVLEGRSTGGFGLCWDPLTRTKVLAVGGSSSRSSGSVVCIWDVQQVVNGNSRLRPVQVLPTAHQGATNDISCHPSNSGVFATAGDDGAVRLHDSRSAGSSSSSDSSVLFVTRHGDTLDCVQWEPRDGHLIAAGSGDGRLYILDSRYSSSSTRITSAAAAAAGAASSSRSAVVLEHHQHAAGVAQVEWSTAAQGVVASCSEDGFVVVVDAATVPPSPAAAKEGNQGEAAAAAAAAVAARRSRKTAVPQRLGGGGSSGGAGQDPVRQHLRRVGGGADGAPRGLLFLHAGHSVCEALAWNPVRPWMVASVGRCPVELEEGQPPSDEPVLQVWEPLRLAAAAAAAAGGGVQRGDRRSVTVKGVWCASFCRGAQGRGRCKEQQGQTLANSNRTLENSAVWSDKKFHYISYFPITP